MLKLNIHLAFARIINHISSSTKYRKWKQVYTFAFFFLYLWVYTTYNVLLDIVMYAKKTIVYAFVQWINLVRCDLSPRILLVNARAKSTQNHIKYIWLLPRICVCVWVWEKRKTFVKLMQSVTIYVWWKKRQCIFNQKIKHYARVCCMRGKFADATIAWLDCFTLNTSHHSADAAYVALYCTHRIFYIPN